MSCAVITKGEAGVRANFRGRKNHLAGSSSPASLPTWIMLLPPSDGPHPSLWLGIFPLALHSSGDLAKLPKPKAPMTALGAQGPPSPRYFMLFVKLHSCPLIQLDCNLQRAGAVCLLTNPSTLLAFQSTKYCTRHRARS